MHRRTKQAKAPSRPKTCKSAKALKSAKSAKGSKSAKGLKSAKGSRIECSGGKQEFAFTYLGGTCVESDNQQTSWCCTDMGELPTKAKISVTNADGSKEYFTDIVNKKNDFTVTFPPQYISVKIMRKDKYNGKEWIESQIVQFHAGCSAPYFSKDTFGAILVPKKTKK